MKLITDDGQELDIAHVRVADLGPDDIIVLHCKGPIAPAMLDYIKVVMKQMFGDLEVLVLADSLKMSISRRTDGDGG